MSKAKKTVRNETILSLQNRLEHLEEIEKAKNTSRGDRMTLIVNSIIELKNISEKMDVIFDSKGKNGKNGKNFEPLLQELDAALTEEESKVKKAKAKTSLSFSYVQDSREELEASIAAREEQLKRFSKVEGIGQREILLDLELDHVIDSCKFNNASASLNKNERLRLADKHNDLLTVARNEIFEWIKAYEVTEYCIGELRYRYNCSVIKTCIIYRAIREVSFNEQGQKEEQFIIDFSAPFLQFAFNKNNLEDVMPTKTIEVEAEIEDIKLTIGKNRVVERELEAVTKAA